MKSIALAITLMLMLAVASLSMAFDVSVNVPQEAQQGSHEVYKTVEMKPMQEKSEAASASNTDDAEALVAEKK